MIIAPNPSRPGSFVLNQLKFKGHLMEFAAEIDRHLQTEALEKVATVSCMCCSGGESPVEFGSPTLGVTLFHGRGRQPCQSECAISSKRFYLVSEPTELAVPKIRRRRQNLFRRSASHRPYHTSSENMGCAASPRRRKRRPWYSWQEARAGSHRGREG